MAGMEGSAPKPASPQRRWFQFSLRTLLIVVGLLSLPCVYVVHEAMFVQERKQFLLEHPSLNLNPWYTSPYPRKPPLPWLRRLLGDEGVGIIGLHPTTGEAERGRMTILFPEAVIIDDPADDPAIESRSIPSRDFGMHDVITYPELPPNQSAHKPAKPVQDRVPATGLKMLPHGPIACSPARIA